MTDKDIKKYRLAVFVNAVLLRTDSPDVSRLSNMMYKELMISNPDSFASIGTMAEKAFQQIMAEELPSSILDGNDNKLPEGLRPSVRERVEARLEIFLASKEMEDKQARFEDAARRLLDQVGWHYGIINLPEAVDALLNKLRRQIKVYECSMNLANHYIDIEPLYEEAKKISLGEKIRKDNGKDVAEFYTALCENTRTSCTKIIARFSRDLLKSICENPGWVKLNESNIKLRENCRRFVEQFDIPEDYLGLFSNPDVSDIEEYI